LQGKSQLKSSCIKTFPCIKKILQREIISNISILIIKGKVIKRKSFHKPLQNKKILVNKLTNNIKSFKFINIGSTLRRELTSLMRKKISRLDL